MTDARRITRNADNFARMLEHVTGGMPADQLTSDELARTARRCQSCRETDLCENWLDQAARSDRRAPGFCPNTAAFWWRLTDEASPA